MNYTKERLKEYTIYALREIGKKLGVKSPTSLNKQQLIEQIIGVSNGTITPTTTVKGRPSKKNSLSANQNKDLEKKIDKCFSDFKAELLKIIN